VAKKAETERKIASFFKRCGISGAVDSHVFWQLAEKRHKRAATLLAACIEARERGENCNPYPIKNESLSFANMVASQFDSEKLRSVASWVLEEKLAFDGHRTLEVGCDNGILLCLLASLHPNGQFVGIDFCEEAIALARHRASDLGLQNVEFVVARLTPEISARIGAGFRVVLAVTVFHELLFDGTVAPEVIDKTRSETALFSLQDVDRHFAPTFRETHLLAIVRKLLADDGVFISVDRWPCDSQTLRWIRLAELHGLSVSLPRSSLLEFNLQGRSETLPLTVFGGQSGKPADVSEVLGFLSYRKFGELFEKAGVQEGPLAELMFSALDKRVACSYEAAFNDGSGTERVEIGVASGLAYVYRTTSNAYRRLAFMPTVMFHEYVGEIGDLYQFHRSHASIGLRSLDRVLMETMDLEAVITDPAQ
jgi:SAM-dependent methyltransferase